jgi:hypothetical protein
MTRQSKSLIAGAALFAVANAGCYGQWALTSALHSWNGHATDNKFVNSLLTWGLIIVPVYELAAVGDFLIFNTIEFWSGKNPVALQEQPDGSAKLSYEGHEYRYRAVSADEIEVSRDGVPAMRYRRIAPGRVTVMAADGRRIADVDDGVAYAQSPSIARVY